MPALDSLYRTRSGLWAPYYAIMEQQLGATAALVDFGNQGSAGRVSASTFTGRKFHASGLSPVWTPVGGVLSAWGTSFDLKLESNWLGLAPILTFNGSSERMTTPDVDFFSRGNGTTDSAFSVGCWMRPGDATTAARLFAKESSGGASVSEYSLALSEDVAGKFGLRFHDASAVVTALIYSATSYAASQWQFVVATYDGTGGATAMTGAELYLNGAIEGSPTRTENASYVAMENGTNLPCIGAVGNGGTPGAKSYPGAMLSGPWTPFFVQAELTAAQVKNIYENMRLGLGI